MESVGFKAIAAFVKYVWAAKTFTAAALKFVAVLAASYAVGRILSPKLRSSLTGAGPLELTRNPLTPRRVVYGECRVGGEIRFHHESGGNDNKYLHLIIVWNTHPSRAIDELYFNDELIPLDGSGNATGTYAGLVRCTHHLGAWDQAADANFVAELGALWTSTDRLRGCTYSALRLTSDPKKFPGGLPTITAKGRWRIPYDPRDVAQDPADPSTWVYTNNAKVCEYDYLRGVPVKIGDGSIARLFGLNADDDEIVLSAAIAAMNVSDEDVPRATGFTRACDVISGNRHINTASLTGVLPGVVVSGTGIAAGTAVVSIDESGGFFTVDRDPTATNAGLTLTFGDSEKRYTTNGAFDLDVPPSTVIDSFLSATGGKLYDVGGDLVMRAGAWEEPDTAIDVGMLRRGGVSCTAPLSYREKVNYVRGVFSDPAQNYAKGDFPPVVSDALIAEDGAELATDLDLSGFVTSPAQAQRLAKMKLLRTRQGIIATKSCNLRAAVALTGENYRFSYDRFGWDEKAFELLEFQLSLERDANGRSGFVLDLTGQETAASIYDWDTAEENTTDTAPNTTLADPRNVAAPTAVTLTSGATTVLIQKDGTAVPRLKVAWTMPVDQAVETAGRIRAHYKRSADSDWSEAAPVQGAQTFLYLLDVVIGTAYDVRVQAENNFGVVSSWATPAAGAHTVAGDTTAPSAIAAPTAVAYPGFNLVTWPASTAADISEYRVYRHTSATFAGATYLGETPGLEWRDQLATVGVTVYYYVLPVDSSENPPLGTTTNVSTASGAVTTLLAPVGATTPSNPTAAAKPGTPVDGTYLAGDGTVFSFITLNVPAMPANAVWQNLLYRRTGSGDWLVAAQLKNTGTATLRLDDLSAGVSYDVATQAWSGAGGSAVVAATGSPFTAPGKTTLPNAPTSVVYVGGSNSGFGRPAVFSAGAQMFVVRANWTAPAFLTNPDIAYYEWAVTTGDSDAEANAANKQRALTTEAILTAGTPIPRYFRVRAVDTSGNASAWVGGGTDMNSAPLWGLAAGTMVNQNAAAVAVTGGTLIGLTNLQTTGGTLTGITNLETTGEKVGGSGARKIEARYVESWVTPFPGLAGGVSHEDFGISISGRGFTTKPDVGKIEVAGTDSYNTDYLAFYNYDNGTNSSTQAWIKIYRPSGANTEAGRYVRLSVEFIEYA